MGRVNPDHNKAESLLLSLSVFTTLGWECEQTSDKPSRLSLITYHPPSVYPGHWVWHHLVRPYRDDIPRLSLR